MVTSILKERLGKEHLRNALFSNWEWGLRFELSGSGTYVQMFTRALERCLILYRYTFQDSNDIHALIRFYFYRPLKKKKHPKELKRLERCGFSLPKKYEREFVQQIFPDDIHTEGSEEDVFEYDYLFPVGVNDANSLAILWAILSNEIGIRPTSDLSGYFIDFKRHLVFHPYDDRGVDIVSDQKAHLVELYNRFNDWLSDSDFSEMKKKFG